MTDYALWTRGLRGPEFSILRGQRGLNDHERRNKLGDPVAIKDGDGRKPLSHLATLYPCKGEQGDIAS